MSPINEAWTEPSSALGVCRSAAAAWAGRPLKARLATIRAARHELARQARAAAATVAARSVRDTLVCEVLPLLDAMRFLERRARSLLAPRKLRRGRPLWMIGVSAEIHRQPLGVVLILGPGNYPLFLPCIQAIQAIVAGNGVCLKPAPGGEAAAALVRRILIEAGLPSDVLCLLRPDTGPAAATLKFDRIVLTGSAGTGMAVLEAAARQLTPSTMELSGCDAAYVMDGADLAHVARCLAYGLALNAGATCIAPRRVFVLLKDAAELERALLIILPTLPAAILPERTVQRLAGLLDQAAQSGARVLRSAPNGPVLVADANSHMALLRQDVFAPWLAIVKVPDMATALEDSARCEYSLGASIFGPVRSAHSFAADVKAGSVCINDVIVPTADPRLPFGGSGRSGFGRTRGAEGLLEMTTTKAISVRRGRFVPHLRAPRTDDEQRFAQLIRLLHARG